MTRTPFDQFSKQFLEEFLAPLGEVRVSQEVPGESRLVDVRFVPSTEPAINPDSLGLLGRIAATPCLIEPFRNAPSDTEVRNCLLKLFLVHAEMQRQANRDNQRLLDSDLPQLWILAPSASNNFLDEFEAKPREDWLAGVYFLGKSLKTAVIALNTLPSTKETLWLRLLGKGRTQQQAITEVLEFSKDDPRRASVLQLLVNWKISLEVTGEIEQEEQSLMATLSQAYLEWEQQTEQRGIQQGVQQGVQQGQVALVLKLLKRRVGKEVPKKLQTRVNELSVAQLEDLGEALLEFTKLADLQEWLDELPK